MDNANFVSYLRTTWHDLSVAGDLRSQYAPFDNPPSGAVSFSYIKCGVMAGTTPVQLVMRNQSAAACIASWTYALINQDAELYSNVATSDPGLPTNPVVWLNPTFGSNGTVTVKPGGQVSGLFSVATPDPRKTLVLRAQLTGAPLRVQSLSPDFAEDY